MTTKRIQQRNENICLYRKRGMTYRSLGRMFKLSHTQIMNIVNEGDNTNMPMSRASTNSTSGDGQ